MNTNRLSVPLGMGLLVSALAGPAHAETTRWYTPDLVQQGARVYAANCAECHGADASSTPQWRQADAEGHYPPPPLDGSAHAWHHPLPMLRNTLRKGGAPVGGRMPPFGDKLSAREMDAAIAYFQDKWPDDIYGAWRKRNGKAARFLKVAAPADAPDPVTAGLRKILPNAEVGPPEPTPLPGIQQVKVGNRFAYVTTDGHYALVGDLLDLKQGVNLTETRRARDTADLLAAVAQQDMVIYPAAGSERSRITVFTDTSCPYCRKLHREIPALQQAGVTVHYIPFPRNGTASPAARTLRAVWCDGDKRQALDDAMAGRFAAPADSDCTSAKAVDAGFRLARRLGLRGTPGIVLPDGVIQPGYRPAGRLLSLLGLSATKTGAIGPENNR